MLARNARGGRSRYSVKICSCRELQGRPEAELLGSCGLNTVSRPDFPLIQSHSPHDQEKHAEPDAEIGSMGRSAGPELGCQQDLTLAFKTIDN